MKSFFKFISRNKAYAAINVLGLAIALMFILIIGAYTWQETHIDTWHSKADRTYILGIDFTNDGRQYYGSHWKAQFRLRDRFPEIETTCAVTRQGSMRMVTRPDGESLGTKMIFVDSTFYDVFDFGLSQGDKATALRDPNSAIISEAYARRAFGNEDPIGKSLKVEGDSVPVVVTAVMEPMNATMLVAEDREPIDMLLRFERIAAYNESKIDDHMSNGLGAAIFMVTAPGSDLPGKVEEIKDYFATFYWMYQYEGMGSYPLIVPLKEAYMPGADSEVLASGDETLVRLLFAMGLAILLFAVTNYVNLTVAQSTRRAKEMAVRRLLGNSRGGIALRLIGESCLVVLFSFLIGLGLAAIAMPYAAQLLNVSLSLSTLLNPFTLIVGLVLLCAIGVAAGIIPAIVISQAKPIDVVRGTFRRHSRSALSKVFIVLQNAATVIMLVATLTIYLQLNHLVSAPLGFEYKDRIVLYLTPDLNRRLGEAVKKLSCVEQVSYSAGHPGDGGNNNTVTLEGKTISTQILEGEPDFFDFFGLGLVRDNGGDSKTGIYVNEQFLRDFSLPLDAEEYPLSYGDGPKPRIRGVVKDFLLRDALSQHHSVIIPIYDRLPNSWSVNIKIKGDPAEAWRQICEVFREVGDGHELTEYESKPFMEQTIAQRFERENRIVKIVAIFALVAVIISMLGLVAMSTYYVQQRSREIAVRKVFGSTSASVLRRLLKSFLIYVAVAIVIAVPLAWWLMSDWLSEYSYRIPLYWWIFVAAGAVCIVISLLSVWLQSWRAASSNPVKALRQN